MVRLLICAMAILPLLTATNAYAGKKKKKGSDDAPSVGWVVQGDRGACYVPPDFTGMASGPKRVAWQEARNEVMGQWSGDRGDGIAFEDKVITNIETVMLSEADRIEAVSLENLEQCKDYMKSGDPSAWAAWLTALPGKLTEGECRSPPLDYTLYDYLNINTDWQISAPVCQGDYVIVHGTEADYFQLEEGGPWINVVGDANQVAASPLPCTIEGCLRGQLIMRFTGESGVQTVYPVGIETKFRAPEHGRIEVMINDDSWSDNKFKVERGLEHHTGIEYKPVGK